jgi:hypothetical protein
MDWTLFSEKRPEYYLPVLGYSKQHGINIVWLSSDGENYMWTIYKTDMIIKITRWQYLPEKPGA